jgi:hypothetical protein
MEGHLMDAVRELDDSQLEYACGGSTSLQLLLSTWIKMANNANTDLMSAADHQRQLNDRMAQLRAAQAKLGDLQI